jgi:hypothetical protein
MLNPVPEIEARLTLSATELTEGACRVRVQLENVSAVSAGGSARRDHVLSQSLVSAHVLVGLTGGTFVSLLDPPEQFEEAARACTNAGVFPVLAGAPPDRSILLISPIILYDYPQVAPESAGDFFDGTEMDEMLTLRVLTLTDAEKAEIREADPHARRILERTEALNGNQMLQTHGTIRELRNVTFNTESETMSPNFVDAWHPFRDPNSRLECVHSCGTALRVGDRVRLRPQKTADIMDMALQGKVAVIAAIEQDLDDRIQLAVVLDDDPGREFGMSRQPGHRFFFSLDEVEVCKPEELA